MCFWQAMKVSKTLQRNLVSGAQLEGLVWLVIFAFLIFMPLYLEVIFYPGTCNSKSVLSFTTVLTLNIILSVSSSIFISITNLLE